MADGRWATRKRRRRRHRRRTLIVGTAVVLLAAAGSGVGLALTAGSGPSYRVATAATASVTQDLTSVGTLGTVATSTVSFPISGTVESVLVAVGDRVDGGQTVATLNTTALKQSVNSAKSTLAEAQQTLASDEAAQSSGGSTTSSAGSSDHTAQTAAERPIGAPSRSAAPTRSAAPSGTSAAAKLRQAVQKAQQGVSAAQAALDKELSDLGQDLRALTANGGACAAVTGEAPAQISYDTSADKDGTISGTAGEQDTVTLFSGQTQIASQHGDYSFTGLSAGNEYTVKIQPATPADSIDATKCADAIASMIAKYTSARGADSDSYLKTLSANLASAEQNLDLAVQNLAAATQGQPGPPSGAGSRQPSGGGGGGSGSRAQSSPSKPGRGSTGSAPASGGGKSGVNAGGGQSGVNAGGGKVITPEQLAADQAGIDAAAAEVSAATQNLAQATLTSPIAGTVAAVGLSPDATVGASSSSATVTIIGGGAKQVTTTVGLADIDKVKVGDKASVKVDGVSTLLTGTVSSIGLLNSTTGSTTTYPVKILLDPSGAKLYDGSGASVSITVNAVRDVLTVPSSAVHHLGVLNTVSVLKRGKVSTVRVTLGAVGADLTQIKSGLAVGDHVVLADLSAPLPSGGFNPANNRGGLFGAGGGGGGGLAGRGNRVR